MKSLALAGIAGFAAACAHAQLPTPAFTRTFEPVVVTATRSALEAPPTLRDAVVVSRDDLEAARGLTLAEVLQRHAGVEIRANGGPGQTSGLFLRGAGAAQTLVLVDGMRVGSATSGATAIEAIPLEMIERIEVVKGPMSGLYGSDAIGGVVQVFTRGRGVPHLFASAALGSDRDRRASAGLATVDGNTQASLAFGWRKVDARSASSPREPFGVYDPDRDPHENAFVTMRASQRMWTGEVLQLEAFASDSRTSYDGGDPADRSRQSLGGARLTSSTMFLPWWSLRLAVSHARDRQRSEGGNPSFAETRQSQAAFINEFRTGAGTAMLGVELQRQDVRPTSIDGAAAFSTTRRDTTSYFAALNESWAGQRVEANVRRDEDDQYGHRNTGSVSYGTELLRGVQGVVTAGRGFRVPSFNDLYFVQFLPYYIPDPQLRPEKSKSVEATLKGAIAPQAGWRVTAFDNRIEDLISATTTVVEGVVRGTVANIARARIRGVELAGHGQTYGIAWRAQVTLQRPINEESGELLRQRARRFGSVDASRAWGAWTAGMSVVASGARYDGAVPSDANRLGGYARIDARARYAIGRHWSVELSAMNLTDRRYENALGYEGQRRGGLLAVRFDAF